MSHSPAAAAEGSTPPPEAQSTAPTSLPSGLESETSIPPDGTVSESANIKSEAADAAHAADAATDVTIQSETPSEGKGVTAQIDPPASQVIEHSEPFPPPPQPNPTFFDVLSTPAPPHNYTSPEPPGAPPPNPPAKDLPTSTPSSSATPAPAVAPIPRVNVDVDVSEFDPFATPPAGGGGRSVGGMGMGMSGASPSRVGAEKALPPIRTQMDGPHGRGNDAKPSGAENLATTTPRRDGHAAGVGTSSATATAISTPSSSRPHTPAPSIRVGGTSTPTPRDSRDGPSTPRQANTPGGEPGFNFSGFLKDLRQKSADPIARYLKSFLSNFAKKPFTVNEQIKLIHDFLRFIAEKMVLCEPWKSQSPAEFENAMEAMEKLVMNRLYNYTFTPQLVPTQPVTTDDLERDAVFAQRVRLFGWVREKHLDVPEGEASQGFLGFAEQELLKINHYKAPRDKMICILNCCKVIFGLIRHTMGAEATSADAFVPILIFVVLRANPDCMLSNVEYISRFRTASKLQGEAGYYLSSLMGAIAFIEAMDASSLSNITQDEFELNVERAIQDLPPSPSTVTSRPLGPSEMSPFAAATPGEEPARPLSLSTSSFQALDNTRRFFQRTGNLAHEAVSKPLNAIGKILDNIQQPGTQSEGEEEEEEDEEVKEMERKWRAGGERDREAEARLERNLNLTPGAGAGSSSTPGSTPRNAPRKSRRPETPESPSGRFARLGISPGDESLSISRAATPSADIPLPDFSSELQTTLDASSEAYEQTRRANVQTLHQMFPDLDEEVLEAVLEGCGDDLGVAIDRLLEM
ncbi:Vacuolar protein sorting-associated protein 9a [Saitozyma sp. JCM 24511]|nr:Vacuolar protein sorting-associated protein 9a [Saitozyma sp. JCM 24511]